MDQTVIRTIIDDWVDKNGPNGMLRLAERSRVSASTIQKALAGRVPKKQRTRDRLCVALGVREDALFPLVGAKGRKSAS